MIPRRGHVHFRKPVSDVELHLVLQRIAERLGHIVVHSGDRHDRPKGSPARSLHLSNRAADLHVPGMPDAAVFDFLKANKSEIFASVVHHFQVIHHGKFTETEGEHIHLGDYHFIKADTSGPGASFFVEGLTSLTSGRYWRVN